MYDEYYWDYEYDPETDSYSILYKGISIIEDIDTERKAMEIVNKHNLVLSKMEEKNG